MDVGQNLIEEKSYDNPEVTLSTKLGSLHVLRDSLVDFQNLKDNGFNLLTDVNFQGCENYFNRLNCPVYPHLMKDFGVHEKSYVYQDVSFSKGKKIIINEQRIAKLLYHNGEKSKCYDAVQKWSDLMEVNRTIFKSQRVSKTDGLYDHLRI